MPKMEEELRKLKIFRSHCKGTISRIETFINDPAVFSSATIEMLEARKQKLNSTLKDYEVVQMDILTIDEKDSEQVGVVEEKYYTLLSKINSALNILRTSTIKENQSYSDCKLPDLGIPIFDGKDFTKFKPFYDLFVAVIDKNPKLQDVQKLFYLRKYLLDDALAVIVNLPLVNQSYSEALQLLQKRFDNKSRLILNHIGMLLDLTPMQRGTAPALRTFLCHVQQQLHALKNLEQPVDKWDMLLISILTRKLDQMTNRAYQLDRDVSRMPSMAEFLDFLEKRAIALEDSQPINNKSPNDSATKSMPSKVTNVVTKDSKSTLQCKYCSKTGHKIFACPEFASLGLHERQSFVNAKELCTICLKPHTGKCKFNFKCKLCKQAHNTLLHPASDIEVTQAPVSNISNCVSTNVLLPTVRVKLINSVGQEIYARALLDTGSQVSLVTGKLVKQLGLKPIVQHSNVIGIGNNQSSLNQIVKLPMFACQSNIKFILQCHVIDTITSILPQQEINVSNWDIIIKKIHLADINFNIPDEISILLGADVYFNILLDGTIKLENGPVLQNTLLGYVVAGYIQNKVCNSAKLCNSANTVELASYEPTNLCKIMEQFWLSEKIPEPTVKSSEELTKAENVFQSSMKVVNKRFYVDMPLVSSMDELQLGDSFSVAYNRFLTLEKRFKRDPLLLAKYKQFIEEYIELGHAKVVDIKNYDDIYTKPVFFLAHHAVINEASKTTKLRVVFDGSMQSRQKVSLNDVMLNGPVVQSELFDILILFRTYPFVLICDIQKMFRNIFINSQQCCLQNILWRDDPLKPISCLQLQTVTYGLKASTFLATRCLIELARQYEQELPLASQAMFLNTFVDDVLTGSDDINTLQELKNQLILLLNKGSFTLHKWCSNHPQVLKDMPEELMQFESIDINKNNLIKTLGLMFNIDSDYFIFSTPDFDKDYCLNTKRKILSFIGKIFDPMGLIGPVVIVAKLFMQELWSAKVDWDSELPEGQLKSWNIFLTNLNLMKTITIPRCVNMSEFDSVELWGYSDASIKAFGACLYLRLLMKDGRVVTNLLCSKSRVAPLNKTHTIPQLELNSALLLAQLAHKVSKVLSPRFVHKMFLNSDSQIVLSWISAGVIKSNVYVNNRVKQITELTKKSCWSYVRTNDNPADLISRGIQPHLLQGNDLWWHGPTYLANINFSPTADIVKVQDLPPTDPFEDDYSCHITQVESFPLLKKYSDLNKLQRVIGYIYRFYNNCLKNKNKITNSGLTPQELNNSMKIIVRYAQRKQFSKEIESVLNNKNIKSGVGNLHPFVDSMGLLRVGGRLENNNSISYDKKHPVILPKNCNIIHLIIQNEHLRLMHAGPKLCLSSLSQRYHILNGIREVKKVLHKCIKCARLKAEAARQLMGSLPPERITASRPFQHVGIDFCGPFNMKVARVRKPIVTKGYIAIFVCFAVKAIHLELVSDLTTESFLACLKRFVSRRGMPTKIFCDNAKTFKGASNTLKALYDLQASKDCRVAVNNYCSKNYIEFQWIPSYSPTFGGLWEAGVKSVKHHFKRVVGILCLTYEELNTVINQIEAILNSRPLLAANSYDCDYLTPGHFLIGTALTSYPETDLTEIPINRLKFWKLCTKLQQDFWKLWHKDYITQLQSRPKWRYQDTNLKVGDLVFVKQLNTSPLTWPMGRIIQTFPGNDGKVRVADVKVNGKIYRRAITKLSPLPLD